MRKIICLFLLLMVSVGQHQLITADNSQALLTRQFGKSADFETNLISGNTVTLKETNFDPGRPIMLRKEMMLAEIIAVIESSNPGPGVDRQNFIDKTLKLQAVHV